MKHLFYFENAKLPYNDLDKLSQLFFDIMIKHPELGKTNTQAFDFFEKGLTDKALKQAAPGKVAPSLAQANEAMNIAKKAFRKFKKDNPHLIKSKKLNDVNNDTGIFEKYEFLEVDSTVKHVEYNFTNRDNIVFKVIFKPKYYTRDDVWVREYDTKTKINNRSFQELNLHDTYNIVNTLTNITNDYLNKYQPEILEIEHIETDAEMKDRMKTGKKLDSTTVTKRALINKRSLEKNITPLYDYQLVGSVSIITKKEPA